MLRVRYRKRKSSTATYITKEKFTCQAAFEEEYPDYFFVEWVQD